MTKSELLIELYQREKYNLSCYSRDYLSENAKKGFEVQYDEHKEKVNLLEEIIEEYERRDENGGSSLLDVSTIYWMDNSFV